MKIAWNKKPFDYFSSQLVPIKESIKQAKIVHRQKVTHRTKQQEKFIHICKQGRPYFILIKKYQLSIWKIVLIKVINKLWQHSISSSIYYLKSYL